MAGMGDVKRIWAGSNRCWTSIPRKTFPRCVSDYQMRTTLPIPSHKHRHAPCEYKSGIAGYVLVEMERQLTAFNSPRFCVRAKCALRLALLEPAATPHSARRMLLKLRTMTRASRGNAGDTQSSTMAASLKKSAASLQALHSGSRLVPSLAAKRIVPIRPVES